MYNFNFMYVMKKLLLIILVFIVSIETIYSQDFLGKNKVEVKAKFSEGAGNGDFIKSFGYEGYMYVSPNLRDMVIVIFNNKGICFLECLVTKDKKFIDSLLYNYCNDDN